MLQIRLFLPPRASTSAPLPYTLLEVLYNVEYAPLLLFQCIPINSKFKKKQGIKIANKHKRRSTALIIRKPQIKATMKYPTRVAKIKTIQCQVLVRMQSTWNSHIWLMGQYIGTTTLENRLAYLLKPNIHILYHPILLGIYSIKISAYVYQK